MTTTVTNPLENTLIWIHWKQKFIVMLRMSNSVHRNYGFVQLHCKPDLKKNQTLRQQKKGKIQKVQSSFNHSERLRYFIIFENWSPPNIIEFWSDILSSLLQLHKKGEINTTFLSCQYPLMIKTFYGELQMKHWSSQTISDGRWISQNFFVVQTYSRAQTFPTQVIVRFCDGSTFVTTTGTRGQKGCDM